MRGSCSSINKPLAISKTTSTFPWKAQSKQAAKADLSTLPLLTKARCLLKNYFSLFLTALLSPIAHSPLLFPPHSLSCLRLCRRLVLSSRDLALFLAFSDRLSPVPSLLFLSPESASCQAAVDLCSPSATFTITHVEKWDPHGRRRQRSASCRMTSSWSACPFDVMAISKYMPQPASLSKSFKLLTVYFSTSHVPLVTDFWREQSCGCRHTILSCSQPAQSEH